MRFGSSPGMGNTTWPASSTLASTRRERLGTPRRHRSLHAEHAGPRRATRWSAGRRWPGSRPRPKERLGTIVQATPTGIPRCSRKCRAGGPHLGRPAHLRHRRRLAAERARGVGIPSTRSPTPRASDEACQVLKGAVDAGQGHVQGALLPAQRAPLAPKPVQRPYPELMIGGGGEKVTLEIGRASRRSLERLGVRDARPQGRHPRRRTAAPPGATQIHRPLEPTWRC